MRSLTSLLLSLAIVAGCSSSSSTAAPSTTIGASCNANSDCGGDLYCYLSAAKAGEIVGQCTVDCTASATTDSCKSVDPNTACLVAGVCARQCGNGEACPSGTQCNSAYGICERHCDATGTTETTSQVCR